MFVCRDLVEILSLVRSLGAASSVDDCVEIQRELWRGNAPFDDVARRRIDSDGVAATAINETFDFVDRFTKVVGIRFHFNDDVGTQWPESRRFGGCQTRRCEID